MRIENVRNGDIGSAREAVVLMRETLDAYANGFRLQDAPDRDKVWLRVYRVYSGIVVNVVEI